MRLDQQPPSHPPSPVPFSDIYFMSMKEVCARTGFSRTHIYRLERNSAFPRRRKLGPSKIAFVRSEVDEWSRNRPLAPLPSDLDV